MRPQIVKILFLMLFLFNSISMLAQKAGPPTPRGGGTRGPEFPLDNDIYILFALGLALGFYATYKKLKTKNTCS